MFSPCPATRCPAPLCPFPLPLLLPSPASSLPHLFSLVPSRPAPALTRIAPQAGYDDMVLELLLAEFHFLEQVCVQGGGRTGENRAGWTGGEEWGREEADWPGGWAKEGKGGGGPEGGVLAACGISKSTAVACRLSYCLIR